MSLLNGLTKCQEISKYQENPRVRQASRKNQKFIDKSGWGCQEFTIWKKYGICNCISIPWRNLMVSEEPTDDRRCSRKMDFVKMLTVSIIYHRWCSLVCSRVTLRHPAHTILIHFIRFLSDGNQTFNIGMIRALGKLNLNGNYLGESIAKTSDFRWHLDFLSWHFWSRWW